MPLPSTINFRDVKNLPCTSLVIEQLFYLRSIVCTGVINHDQLQYQLDILHQKLRAQYLEEELREKEIPTEKQEQVANEKANCMFSQWLQDMTYFVNHINCPADYIHDLLEKFLDQKFKYENKDEGEIIEKDLFFYVDSNHELQVWCDPQEGVTALGASARTPFVDITLKILQKLMKITLQYEEDIYPKIHQKIIELLIHTDNHQNTLLITAASAGNIVIVKTLLELAKILYGESTDPKLIQFILAVNDYKSSALFVAANNGHYEVVKFILETAKNIYGDIHSEAFKAFINQENQTGYTALNTACCKRHEAVSRILIEYGADPFIENKKGFSAALNALNKKLNWDFIPAPLSRHRGKDRDYPRSSLWETPPEPKRKRSRSRMRKR